MTCKAHIFIQSATIQVQLNDRHVMFTRDAGVTCDSHMFINISLQNMSEFIRVGSWCMYKEEPQMMVATLYVVCIKVRQHMRRTEVSFLELWSSFARF